MVPSNTIGNDDLEVRTAERQMKTMTINGAF